MNTPFRHAMPAALALALTLAPVSPVPAAPADLGSAGPPRFAPLFAPCVGAHRVTCVVDGDTFWLDGAKIRIADINAPEVSHPSCAYEAQLGAAATRRLTELLNAGAFTLATEGRAVDRYGRLLRVVRRGQRSLGQALVEAGLAEPWTGHRRDWCAAG